MTDAREGDGLPWYVRVMLALVVLVVLLVLVIDLLELAGAF